MTNIHHALCAASVEVAFLRCPLNIEVFPDSIYAVHTTSPHCICLKICPPISKSAADQARHLSHRFDLSLLISQLCIVDDRRPHHPMTTPNQRLQGESNFGDRSGHLFSIYSKATQEEDNKMTERWQKDADGILIFVSPRVDIHLSLHTN
jgi:hypothetical protein